MGNTFARRLLGLLELAQIYHRIFPLLLSLWNRCDESSRNDDTYFKGYADTNEGKKEGSLCSRKM